MRNDGWKPQISNPQSNPQFAMSYTTRRYFGSPRSRDRSLRNTGARFRALVRSLEEERQLSQAMCASTNLMSSSAALHGSGRTLVTTDHVLLLQIQCKYVNTPRLETFLRLLCPCRRGYVGSLSSAARRKETGDGPKPKKAPNT